MSDAACRVGMGILLSQLHDYLAEFRVDAGPSWWVGGGPFPCEETAVPGQQRGWCDEAVAA